jgi:hypothetical protein
LGLGNGNGHGSVAAAAAGLATDSVYTVSEGYSRIQGAYAYCEIKSSLMPISGSL